MEFIFEWSWVKYPLISINVVQTLRQYETRVEYWYYEIRFGCYKRGFLWKLSIVLFSFKSQSFGDCIVSPSSQTFRSYLDNHCGPGIYPKFRKHVKTETESSLRNVVFLNKNMAMGNVQKHNVVSPHVSKCWHIFHKLCNYPVILKTG
jgi:hypothetical protein